MKSKNLFLLALFTLICGLFSVPAARAYDIFMKIEGIPGESTRAGRKDWIDVYSFSHSITNSADLPVPRHADLVIEKRIDRTTPIVNLTLNQGELITRITLEFQKGVETPHVFYKVVMEDVVITGARTHGKVGDDVIYETLSLDYKKITWTYTILDPKGGTGNSTTTSWDLRTNQGS